MWQLCLMYLDEMGVGGLQAFCDVKSHISRIFTPIVIMVVVWFEWLDGGKMGT